jgi:hypothetical protein
MYPSSIVLWLVAVALSGAFAWARSRFYASLRDKTM